MTDTVPDIIDAQARESALDVTTSFIVQAPAGSGKTGLLTQRVLALLARAGEPEEILAITFTHKAAGEMRNRILASLQSARDDTPPDAPHERLTWELARAALKQSDSRQWDLVRNPARLRVQTIDSLCAGLTRQMPLLSAFGVQPSVCEDADRLYAEAARKTLADIESGTDWSPHIEHLLKHLDNNLNRVAGLLSEMLSRRDHWLRHVADSGNERLQRSTLEKVLHKIVEESLQQLADTVPVELVDEITGLAAIAADNLQQLDIDSPIHACAELHSLPGHRVAHLPVWRGLAQLLLTNGNWRKEKGVNKNLGFPPGDKDSKQRMQALLSRLQQHDRFRERLAGLQHLPEPVYSEAQWEILQAMIELLPIAVGHLQVVFSAHGQVDFTEIAQRAVQALGAGEQPTDLALALDYRIYHILVDEFQDTSLSQYQLLERLTAEWTEDDGRTLFLVGDPMQSIYRFREAEVALYLRARKHGIGLIKPKPLTLSVNFRSQAPLVDWLNRTFPSVLPDREDLTTGAVTYAPSDAFHRTDDLAAVHVEPVFSDDSGIEARKVVEIVQQVQQQHPHGSIAILVRARTHLQAIVRTLAEADIGFRAVEIEHLADRQPVIDLVSLTRALTHLADRVAWISLLRAPWCGLSLAGLEQLLAADPQALVWELITDPQRRSGLVAGDQAGLARVIEILTNVLRRRQTMPLSEWIEGAWLALGGPATLVQHRDLSDCEQYFRLLRSMESDGVPVTVKSLQDGIAKLYASTDPGSDERLQVMTIHKAKGLEFDTVILPGLGRKPRPRQPHLLNWAERASEDDRSELMLAPITASGEDRDAINGYLHYLEQIRETNEASRLLYVAATRAKHRLFLLGHTRVRPLTDGAELQKPVNGSLLNTLWPAIEPVFARAMAQAEIPPDDAQDASAPGWLDVQGIARLPAAWALPVEFEDMGQAPSVESDRLVEYSWVGPAARHIGTIVHRLLEDLVHHGPDQWTVADPVIRNSNIRNELLSLGVGSDELDRAVETVLQAIRNTLADERGRWILDNGHRQSRCEYALVSIDGQGNPATSVLDRTFIDEAGKRWIIDYKTSTHTGGGLDEFLDREQERYQGQMNRYAQVFGLMEKCEVRLGLYFPLLGSWREWEYSPD